MVCIKRNRERERSSEQHLQLYRFFNTKLNVGSICFYMLGKVCVVCAFRSVKYLLLYSPLSLCAYILLFFGSQHGVLPFYICMRLLLATTIENRSPPTSLRTALRAPFILQSNWVLEFFPSFLFRMAVGLNLITLVSNVYELNWTELNWIEMHWFTQSLSVSPYYTLVYILEYRFKQLSKFRTLMKAHIFTSHSYIGAMC